MPKTYKYIRVPTEVHEKLMELSKKLNVPLWKVIMEAITFYEQVIRKPKVRRSLPRLDKASWYAFKISQSVGAFKENPSKQNFEYLQRTCQQIEERIGVDCDLVLKMAEEYMQTKSVSAKIELNDVTKLVVADIIVKMLFGEEEYAPMEEMM